LEGYARGDPEAQAPAPRAVVARFASGLAIDSARPDCENRIMGYPTKTEHAGPKHGKGAYWGHKREAKIKSNRKRRKNGQREIREEMHPGYARSPA